MLWLTSTLFCDWFWNLHHHLNELIKQLQLSHMQKTSNLLVFLYVFFDTMLKNGPIVNYCSQRNNGSLLRFSVRVQNWDLVEVNIPLPWVCSDVVSCTYAYNQVRRFLYQRPLTKIGLKEEQNPKKNLDKFSGAKPAQMKQRP